MLLPIPPVLPLIAPWLILCANSNADWDICFCSFSNVRCWLVSRFNSNPFAVDAVKVSSHFQDEDEEDVEKVTEDDDDDDDEIEDGDNLNRRQWAEFMMQFFDLSKRCLECFFATTDDDDNDNDDDDDDDDANNNLIFLWYMQNTNKARQSFSALYPISTKCSVLSTQHSVV